MFYFTNVVFIALYKSSFLREQKIIYFLLEIIAKTIQLRERADYFK